MRTMWGVVCGLLVVASVGWGFTPPQSHDLGALARTDQAAFVAAVTRDGESDYEKAEAIVAWLADNFDWTATDDQERTVEQIIERGGGNCAELARVTTAMLEHLGLRMRRVREINLHVASDARQERAEKKVVERGNSLSVFGRGHNDHRWIEIYDRTTESWFPADPSLGLVGDEAWLRARLGFGERNLLDPAAQDIIAPFAVFAHDGEGGLADRTTHYLVDRFDALYDHHLSRLPAWEDWVESLRALNGPARLAFTGEANLHDHSQEIADLAETYFALKEQQAKP